MTWIRRQSVMWAFWMSLISRAMDAVQALQHTIVRGR